MKEPKQLDVNLFGLKLVDPFYISMWIKKESVLKNVRKYTNMWLFG